MANLMKPMGPEPQKQAGPSLDPEKVKQFQQGFFGTKADAGDISNPLSRRMVKINEDPRVAVNNALGALSQMPDEYKKEYAPVLIKTQMILEKGKV